MNPYEVVKGKYPSQKDLSEWSSDKWCNFFKWVERWLEKSGESERFVITLKKMKDMEEESKAPSHPWCEFMWRADTWSDGDGAPHKTMFYKVNGMNTHVLKYLKRHPATVSKEMKAIMEAHPDKLGRAIVQYSTVDSAAGPIVQRDSLVPNAQGDKGITLPSIQAKVMSAILKTVDIYETIAGSLSKEELESMAPEKKVTALSKLFPSIVTALKAKTATNHFTQINIAGGVRDAEKQMLEFLKNKQE